MTEELQKLIKRAEKKRAESTRELIAAEFALRKAVESAAGRTIDTVVIKSDGWCASFIAGRHSGCVSLDTAIGELLQHLRKNRPGFDKLIWIKSEGWL